MIIITVNIIKAVKSEALKTNRLRKCTVFDQYLAVSQQQY